MTEPTIGAVRPARLEDRARLVELLEMLFAGASDTRAAGAAWQSTLPELLRSDRLRVLVVEDTDGVVGLISFSFNQALRYAGEYCQIEELIVDPRGRGKSLGVLLVKSAIEAARDRGCLEIGLYAREETRAFYEKLGFGYRGPEVRLALL